MTTEDFNMIENLLKNDKTFQQDRKKIEKLFETVDSLTEEEKYNLHDELTQIGINMGWSRRKLFVLMQRSVNANISDDLYNFINSYIDALIGNCHSEYITKLNKDPEDKIALCDFVRSEKWIHVDYYIE